MKAVKQIILRAPLCLFHIFIFLFALCLGIRTYRTLVRRGMKNFSRARARFNGHPSQTHENSQPPAEVLQTRFWSIAAACAALSALAISTLTNALTGHEGLGWLLDVSSACALLLGLCLLTHMAYRHARFLGAPHQSLWSFIWNSCALPPLPPVEAWVQRMCPWRISRYPVVGGVCCALLFLGFCVVLREFETARWIGGVSAFVLVPIFAVALLRERTADAEARGEHEPRASFFQYRFWTAATFALVALASISAHAGGLAAAWKADRLSGGILLPPAMLVVFLGALLALAAADAFAFARLTGRTREVRFLRYLDRDFDFPAPPWKIPRRAAHVGLFLITIGVAIPAYAQGGQAVFAAWDGSAHLTGPVSEILTLVLGPLFSDGASSSTVGIVKGMVLVLNYAMLGVAALMLVYIVAIQIGLMAKSGTFFNHRMTSVWTPLRIVLGLALIFPFWNGYNGGQHLVGAAVAWGGGLASTAWSGASRALQQNPAMFGSVRLGEAQSGFKVATAAIQMEICRQIYANAGVPKTWQNRQATTASKKADRDDLFNFDGNASVAADSGGFFSTAFKFVTGAAEDAIKGAGFESTAGGGNDLFGGGQETTFNEKASIHHITSQIGPFVPEDTPRPKFYRRNTDEKCGFFEFRTRTGSLDAATGVVDPNDPFVRQIGAVVRNGTAIFPLRVRDYVSEKMIDVLYDQRIVKETSRFAEIIIDYTDTSNVAAAREMADAGARLRRLLNLYESKFAEKIQRAELVRLVQDKDAYAKLLATTNTQGWASAGWSYMYHAGMQRTVIEAMRLDVDIVWPATAFNAEYFGGREAARAGRNTYESSRRLYADLIQTSFGASNITRADIGGIDGKSSRFPFERAFVSLARDDNAGAAGDVNKALGALTANLFDLLIPAHCGGEIATTFGDAASSIGRAIGGEVGDIVEAYSVPNCSTAMAQTAAFGNILMTIPEISGTLNLFRMLTGFGSGGPEAQQAVPIISDPSFLVYITGYILAHIIPLLPFIFFFFVLIGYIFLVCVAFVGVILWAFSLIRLDGEGLAGNDGVYGFAMLLNIFLRPILYVIGFMVGILVFEAGLQMLTDQFFPAIRAAGLGYNMSSAFLGHAVLFGFFTVLLAQFCFGFIARIGDGVLMFAGSGVQSAARGYQEESMGEGARSSAVAAALGLRQVATARVGGFGGGGGGRASGGPRSGGSPQPGRGQGSSGVSALSAAASGVSGARSGLAQSDGLRAAPKALTPRPGFRSPKGPKGPSSGGRGGPALRKGKAGS